MILGHLNKINIDIFCKVGAQYIHYTKKGTFTAAPHTIFEVVKNTHKYSDFIPWVSKSSITKFISPHENFTELTITFQKVKQLSYLSHVLISGENEKSKNYRIQSTCKEEPLKSLISVWEIEKDSITEGNIEQSNVHYSIEYEFSSPILQLTSHFFLDYVGESMWLIFKEQAEKRQKEIDQQKNLKEKEKSNFTFGKSTNPNEKTDLEHKNKNEDQLKTLFVTNLSEYLAKNTKIHEIYCTNKEFKSKLDKWSNLLNGTNDFEMKLEFKIKNYFIHKN